MVVGLPLFGQAFKGMSLNDLGDTSKWLSALVIGGGLVYVASRIWRGLGRQDGLARGLCLAAGAWVGVYAALCLDGGLYQL